MEESKKWIYLYRITLIKNEENLYYFGIRTFKGNSVNNDTYLGSPTTYAYLWEDTSGYEIKKDIIREELCSEEMLHELRDLEIKLIKKAWKKYGVYHKDENGKCLNAGILKYVIRTKEIEAKISAAIKEHYKNNPCTPETRAKKSAALKEYYKNNPEAREYYKNNPEALVKKSAAMKEYYRNNTQTPEARTKRSAAVKEYYKNNPQTPEARAKKSAAVKEYHRKKRLEKELCQTF